MIKQLFIASIAATGLLLSTQATAQSNGGFFWNYGANGYNPSQYLTPIDPAPRITKRKISKKLKHTTKRISGHITGQLGQTKRNWRYINKKQLEQTLGTRRTVRSATRQLERTNRRNARSINVEQPERTPRTERTMRFATRQQEQTSRRDINLEQQEQANIITTGIRRCEITPDEANQLRERQQTIERFEQGMRQDSDGLQVAEEEWLLERLFLARRQIIRSIENNTRSIGNNTVCSPSGRQI